MTRWTRGAGLAVAMAAAATMASGHLRAQDARTLQQAAAPPLGVWIDSLDLTNAPIRRPGLGRAGGQQAPAAPLTYSLGGAPYVHALPLTVDNDLAIDLNGQATHFSAIIGLDDGPAAGRVGAAASQGTVVFGAWVDGARVFDSGVMHRGDAPKLVSLDLTHARRLVLAVIDANDGTAGDTADWGGALVTTVAGADPRRLAVAQPTPEEAPAIASSRSATPMLNYPRVTGATPGRPFMFLIPASGDGPLTFSARNLPAGLVLNAKTGLITGALRQPGRTAVDVTVTGPHGRAEGPITIVGGDHMLAETPPLGWNSWNAWGATVTADRVRAAADAMVKSGLAAEGYTYINIDDAWEGRARAADGTITTNDKFPDMRGLVDYIHSLGLKAGIYSSPGPTTCQRWPASFQHEEQDARTWASWGFDYLKYDWCSYQGDRTNLDDLKKPYIVMRTALDTLDRDIVFSLCQYGMGNVWEWGQSVGGNLWRMTGDITDTWTSMSSIAFQQTGRETYAGPGHWNDTDMLVVGLVGWGQPSRPTRLTPNEQLTHISLWALQAAPMLIGADLSAVDPWTVDLLGNREVLGVNQDALGKPAGRKSSDGWTEVWARPLADGTTAVGLFNRSPEPTKVAVRWADLGLTGSQPVRDLWQHRDLGSSATEFSAVVARHGVVLIKIGRPKSTT